jgi:hypothetical protein
MKEKERSGEKEKEIQMLLSSLAVWRLNQLFLLL